MRGKTECNDSLVKAMKADVQAMPDRNAKATAVNEMKGG
jgi:hypothetical protein